MCLRSQEEVDAVTIERQPAWSDKRDDRGPFDIIGDVHGCYDELIELLEKLGYDTTQPTRVVPPPGRKAVFVGDLVDRGPKSWDVLRFVGLMVQSGNALCVAGQSRCEAAQGAQRPQRQDGARARRDVLRR